MKCIIRGVFFWQIHQVLMNREHNILTFLPIWSCWAGHKPLQGHLVELLVLYSVKQEDCRNYNTVAEVPLARPSKKWLPGVATVHKNATYVEKKKRDACGQWVGKMIMWKEREQRQEGFTERGLTVRGRQWVGDIRDRQTEAKRESEPQTYNLCSSFITE